MICLHCYKKYYYSFSRYLSITFNRYYYQINSTVFAKSVLYIRSFRRTSAGLPFQTIGALQLDVEFFISLHNFVFENKSVPFCRNVGLPICTLVRRHTLTEFIVRQGRLSTKQ